MTDLYLEGAIRTKYSRFTIDNLQKKVKTTKGCCFLPSDTADVAGESYILYYTDQVCGTAVCPWFTKIGAFADTHFTQRCNGLCVLFNFSVDADGLERVTNCSPQKVIHRFV